MSCTHKSIFVDSKVSVQKIAQILVHFKLLTLKCYNTNKAFPLLTMHPLNKKIFLERGLNGDDVTRILCRTHEEYINFVLFCAEPRKNDQKA
jgi:hypothetical protein